MSGQGSAASWGGKISFCRGDCPAREGNFPALNPYQAMGNATLPVSVMDQIHFQALHIGSAVGMIDARFKRATEEWPVEGWKWAAAIRSKAVDVLGLFARSLPCAKRQPDSPSQQLRSNLSASAPTLSSCNIATNKPRHYCRRLRLLPAL